MGVALLNTLYTRAAAQLALVPADRLGSLLAGFHMAFLVGSGLFVSAALVAALLLTTTRPQPQ